MTRVDTQTWGVKASRLPRTARGVTLTYKVFADDLSGTFSQLDERHANFNGGSVFMYVAGHKQDAVTLKIEAPGGWKIVNGHTERAGQSEFRFPNYDVLIDTPTEVAPDWTADEFEVGGKRYRVVVHSFGDEGGRRKSLVRDIERVVRAQVRMIEAPEFDGYTFLFHFDPTASRGDGMEHLNSTQIVETGPLSDPEIYAGAVGTASHEFFHVWNVKRLRPLGLGPWDFTRPVNTRGLWIAEGFTNYYGKLFMRRAGLLSDEQLLRSYSNAVNTIEGSPGSKLMSAEEASLSAPFLDRAGSEQRTNLGNTAVSYYPKGETLGLVLDLLIRGRTGGRKSLDDVMRRAYEEFYLKGASDSYYLKGRAYTVEEFERLASAETGLDLSDFFARHVRQPVAPPYEEALGLRRPAARAHARAESLRRGAGARPARTAAAARRQHPARLARRARGPEAGRRARLGRRRTRHERRLARRAQPLQAGRARPRRRPPRAPRPHALAHAPRRARTLRTPHRAGQERRARRARHASSVAEVRPKSKTESSVPLINLMRGTLLTVPFAFAFRAAEPSTWAGV